MATWCRLESSESGALLALVGSWRLRNLLSIERAGKSLSVTTNGRLRISGEDLREIDTSGAMLLFDFAENWGFSPENIELEHFREDHRNIVELVRNHINQPETLGTPKPNVLESIGRSAIESMRWSAGILGFVGQASVEMLRTAVNPRLLRLKELFVQLEAVCVNAVGIVSLVTFLIGIVIAYLFGIQIEQYGANIFIVDAVALAMCRELSPILVAVIVAGRSGSAFTAQIGTMKLNEEVDAMTTLGLSPIRVLVLPRLVALMIAMPILVFVGDVVGIVGSMLVADLRLGITGFTFIERLNTVLPVRSFLVGLVKAPVFAFFIACIGCRLGLLVENNAKSVGENTTATVVRSIVAVILLNAAFAVIFVELGI